VKIVLTNNIIYAQAIGAPTAKGGAERFQWLLARALTDTGWSVVVGVRDVVLPGHERVIDGVRFVGMQPGTFVRSWSKFLKTEKPDWFFWRGSDPLWGALLFIAKTKGVRGIFSAAFDTDVQPRIALFRRRHWWPLYAWGLSAADRIFVQHGAQFSDLGNNLKTKAKILPGLVLIPGKVKPRSERGNYIVWVAVLRYHKRPDLLIEIARATPELRYVVCGGRTTFGTPAEFSDKILSNLKSLPNVEYLGDVSHAQTLARIADAAALVSTSDQEGFPNVFLEAWSAGTPVISLRVDPDSIIQERGLGFVSGTVDRAVSDIRGLVASPELFDAISGRARKYVQEVHSAVAVAKLFNKAVLDVE